MIVNLLLIWQWVRACNFATNSTNMSKLFTLCVALIFCCTVYAQPEGVGSDPATNDVPLDGGLLALAVAGAAYGANKRRKSIRH